jgi:hypothetical protein
MASGSRAATITRFFSPFSKEEVHEKIKKDSATWQEEERNIVARNEATKAVKESARLATKRPVGRLKRVRAQAVLVPANMGAEK